MILNDWQIEEEAQKGMLDPFEPSQVRRVRTQSTDYPVVSYGCSSFGYDIRLSPKDVQIFARTPGEVIDVKKFKAKGLRPAIALSDDGDSSYVIIPGHSYALGVSVERFQMPSDVIGVCYGKSTYARAGIIVNCTPLEPGWVGHLTLEFSNSSPADVRMYLGEGCAQIQFHRGDRPSSNYSGRKYQAQGEQVVLPRI